MGIGEKIPLRTLFLAALLPAFILSTACTGLTHLPSGPGISPVQTRTAETGSWKDYLLTDLNGKGNFSVHSLSGGPVLVPVLSASCPACTILLNQQLNEIDRLRKNGNDSVVVVALDIDTEPGPDYISAYHSQFNFSGYAARSPPDLSLALFRTFGPFAVDPTSVPVILVCHNGSDLLLPAGVKTAGTLETLLTNEC